ncbi:hypothetical protein [Wolbachia endosymbiont (group B) of Rhopobota naevana]|uniref:hypothetical protein n=1 Tax=Wolbachia endosymbiont (group B) of Rhopobota naevana TaxID=2954054 RepID=UPI0022279331|nr:hypothetical protein [Wolbachia endosymbiont (group B) of Rhopobota naevana]
MTHNCAFSITLTTLALYQSSLWLFEACSCKPAPRGPPSSTAQLQHFPCFYGAQSSFISSAEAPENFCPRKLAVISVAAITCALALYFLAPLIIGSSAGIGTQLALGAVGAVVGGGIGILTNVAIDQCYVNSATQKAD